MPLTLCLCKLHKLRAGIDHCIACDLEQRCTFIEVLHLGTDLDLRLIQPTMRMTMKMTIICLLRMNVV